MAPTNDASVIRPPEGVLPVAVARTSGPVAPGPSLVRSLFAVVTNPRVVFQEHIQHIPAPLCLLVSGLAFSLFYLQTGLDIAQPGWRGWLLAGALMALGAIVGTAGVGILALIAWVLTRPFGETQPVGWAVKAFGLAYVPSLIYVLLGLFANVVLGWNTALSFGVTGLLWALGPMIVAIRQMAGGRTGVAVVLATICGALMLSGWALIAG